ncbi:hypothetical protein GCM10009557_44140 [Virgisporangium ochraceum]|uniref:Uncharacterized protein n=1 Tax=Virgisporangium ochraceum TaxID=65505 RepID=A0A8J3ZQZ0_9ACTN|nr:hypothetical protein Voc01_030330 [Virgisporangium ochraceum]
MIVSPARVLLPPLLSEALEATAVATPAASITTAAPPAINIRGARTLTMALSFRRRYLSAPGGTPPPWERFQAHDQQKEPDKGRPKDPPGRITVRTGKRLNRISSTAQRPLTEPS